MLRSAAGAVLATAAARSATPPSETKPLSAEDQAFLKDLAHRCFLYFVEQASPRTGIVQDRAGMNGTMVDNAGSTAATGFGLTALCIGASRGWIPKEQARLRVIRCLRYFWAHAYHDHGWFYHFLDANTGTRRLRSEVSSIDTAFLLCGILSTAGYFSTDHEIHTLAKQIYERVDFNWMLNGHPYLLSHGVIPGSGFIPYRWSEYCEASVLYLLAIGSPRHPIPPESWYAWLRPEVRYRDWTFVSGGPLFTHQFSHAWVDFRHQMDGDPSYLNYFQNSRTATYAHRDFCVGLRSLYADYDSDMWGVTASDSPSGYVAWGGPPELGPVDGTLVPCAAAGSLMFSPEICLPVLRAMYKTYGDKIYGRYGFTDAFHPKWKGGKFWVNPDVIGIDLGISLLSVENLLTGNVWAWFMHNPYIRAGMDLAGFQISTPGIALRARRNAPKQA